MILESGGKSDSMKGLIELVGPIMIEMKPQMVGTEDETETMKGHLAETKTEKGHLAETKTEKETKIEIETEIGIERIEVVVDLIGQAVEIAIEAEKRMAAMIEVMMRAGEANLQFCVFIFVVSLICSLHDKCDLW